MAKKENEKEVDEIPKGIPEHIQKYHNMVRERRPELFKNNESKFVKEFELAKTKGAAKRVLKRKLQEMQSS